MGTQRSRYALWVGAVLFLAVGCLNGPLPPETASLSATFLLDEGDSEGIEVILPGTAYRGYTDREGRIVFDNLPPREYQILARAEGYREYRESGILLDPGDNIYLGEIRLEPVPKGGAIVGRVEVEGVPGATVEARLIGSNLVTLSTGDGRIEFKEVPAGNYDVAFYYPGYAADAPISVTVEAGGTVTLGKTVLKKTGTETPPRGIVTGKVRLAGRADAGGVQVFLPGTPHFTTTKPDGTYWLERVESGTHTLLFEKEGFISTRITGFRIASATINQVSDVTLKKIPAQVPRKAASASQPQATPEKITATTPGMLTGWAYYEDAEDHSGITVRILDSPLNALTDKEGKYLFPSVPPGMYTMRAEADGYKGVVLADVEVRPGDVTRAPRMDLAPAEPDASGTVSRVYGQVLLADKGAQPGIPVSLAGTSLIAVTDPEGRFVIENVGEGEYLLVVNREGYEPFQESVQVTEGADVPVPVITLQPVEVFLEVLETVPKNGARKVEVTDRVTLRFRFSERILAKTVKREVFVDPPVVTEVRVPEVDLVVVELLRLAKNRVEFNTPYTVTLGTGIESPQGHRLEEPYVLRFKTGGPRVLGSLPESGDRGVVLTPDEPIVFFFNEMVNMRDFRQKVRVTPDTGEVPVIIGQTTPWGGRIEMQIALEPRRNYRITIPRTVRTIHNDRYENTPYTVRFRSGSYDDLPDAAEEALDNIGSFAY